MPRTDVVARSAIAIGRESMTTTTCPICARAETAGAVLTDPDRRPHTHCPQCYGAILPGMTACAWCGFPVMTRAVAHALELARRTGRSTEPQGGEPCSLIAITVAVEVDAIPVEVQRQIDDFAAAFDEWEARQ